MIEAKKKIQNFWSETNTFNILYDESKKLLFTSAFFEKLKRNQVGQKYTLQTKN
jgi:hypothetical protein